MLLKFCRLLVALDEYKELVVLLLVHDKVFTSDHRQVLLIVRFLHADDFILLPGG